MDEEASKESRSNDVSRLSMNTASDFSFVGATGLGLCQAGLLKLYQRKNLLAANYSLDTS